jgi:indole-3-glycerol phosphate synthase
MILDELASSALHRVMDKTLTVPLGAVRDAAEAMAVTSDRPFESALRKTGMSFICEVKRASPSKGVIAQNFPYLDIAREYKKIGADAVSVLTEPSKFLGNDEYLRGIAREIPLPALRKDFTVSQYQIYEAKTLGASAVLLICAILDADALREYIELAARLGLSALVEAHTESEVKAAVDAGAVIIGVNNRDLRTFDVDLSVSERLSRLIPKGAVFVSESGIRTAADVARLRDCGADAVLIGETLMRSDERGRLLAELRAAGGHDED